jgi:hypothetical protein
MLMQAYHNLYIYVCFLAGVFLFLSQLNQAGATDFEQLHNTQINFNKVDVNKTINPSVFQDVQ